MTKKILKLGSAILIGAIATATAWAGEIDHYVPGVMNIRDLAVPEPGFYGALYNYGYITDTLADANGNKVTSVTVGGANVNATLNVKVNVSVYALAPTFIWVSKYKILGAKYGAYITPTFTNASIEGLASTALRAGQSVQTGQFNVGDIFVQPLWLGWTKKNFDFSAGYGFYIPSGKYQTTIVGVPVVGPVKIEAADNTGLGFWTNQMQGAGYWYPWADRRMAVENALTWEINRDKRGFNLTPGQHLTWNWGVSEYLPLKVDAKKMPLILLEAGPTGYSNFQVTSDSGTAVSSPNVKDHVHAAGLQIGLTSVKRNMTLNFHWFHEYAAADRFQGDAIGLNYALKF